MEQIVERISVTGNHARPLEILRYQHVTTTDVDGRPRKQIGAQRLALATGEEVRALGSSDFEVVSTGELLRRA